MNRIIVAMLAGLAVLATSSFAFAQGVPAVVPLQGVLNAADGTPVDGDTPVTFAFYDGSGTSLWTETYSVSVDNGFFSVGLGAGTNALDLAIFRDNSEIELGIKVGSDAEMSPRMQVGSVPFALRSEWSAEALEAMNAAALQGQTLADLDNRFLQDVPANSVDSSKIADGTITAADIANPTQLYSVSSLFCENEVGTLMTADRCYANQDRVDSCSNSCSGITPVRRRQCDGSCGCGGLIFCQIGQPCNPRGGIPRCANTPIGQMIP